MKKHIHHITLGVIALFTTSITTHSVDLPDTSDSVMAEMPATNVSGKNKHEQQLKNMFKGQKLSPNEAYEIRYAIGLMQQGAQTQGGRERLFGFNSTRAQTIFNKIKSSYKSLNQNEREEFLAKALLMINQNTQF